MSANEGHLPVNALTDHLNPNCYTALRLQHAPPEHLHLTTRRCFIGPIPEGWLKSHRKTWYRHYIARETSSRTPRFEAAAGTSHTTRLTGLDGPSAGLSFAQPFPQPEDVEDEDEDEEPGHATQAEQERLQDAAGPSAQADDGTDTDGVGRDKPASFLKHHESRHRKRQRRKGSTDGPSTSVPTWKRSSFVTRPLKRKPFSGDSATSPPPSSFHTAYSSPRGSRNRTRTGTSSENPPGSMAVEAVDGDQPRTSHGSSLTPHGQTNNDTSTTALIDRNEEAQVDNQMDTDPPRDPLKPSTKTATPGLVKFNTDDLSQHAHDSTVAGLSESKRRRSWRRWRKGEHNPGAIVKVEKMLVRVERTKQELPAEYDENESAQNEARIIEKWREFVVVCRESTEGDEEFCLQIYKTRVIPATAQTHVQGKYAHEVPLSHKKTKINFYSSLDKTLVLWVPSKGGSLIYLLRPRSTASAAEWHTFIRQSLGWKRPTTLQVNVPDLSVALQLENPFGDLEANITEAQKAKSAEAILKTMEAEKAVAGMIIQQAIDALKDNPEWSDVLDTWLAKEKMGLAWKRYDRLEWVYGANERRMYGTLAMQKTHELELRPKDHYPTAARTKKETLTEPAPVEGFLIRLTSQKGNVRRLGRMYHKRLYFTTHNQYLCYCRPAKAIPPPSPQMLERSDGNVPGARSIVDDSPLIYAVNPFPAQDGQIDWLQQDSAANKRHDEEAYKESERKVHTMLNAEGYINLLHVSRVQMAARGHSVADQNLESGSEVDFHESVADTTRDDGKVEAFDEARTFEVVMMNKLIIRLQAYDEQTKREWIHRLRALVRYWKVRRKDDMHLLKSVRHENLERLGIDEEMEAALGQFASKWEVTRSVASPKLFHMCGISCCRAITIAGTLYHKPKRRSTFLRSGVILCHGKLLIFHGTLRKSTGEEVPHIQHNRHSVVDLANCYVYSGLLTEGDLLYQNKTFDANHPGHHALPRYYREDGWTSSDEDTMTCFVIWQARNRSWFRATEDGKGKTRQRLRHVSRLGVPGRSIVFKARSRAERDHWVMSIAMEVERMQGEEDIRVVNS